MSPTVSIIVPVYKTPRQLLEKFLSSALNQTLKEIELIAVDDASGDHCPAILDEWAGRDPRMKVIHREENGRAGVARGQALEVAQGEYVFFADADDQLLSNTCEQLVELADKSSADIVMCGWVTVDEDDVEISRTVFDSQILDLGNDRQKAKAFRVLNFTLWNKLFRRNTIRDLNFRQYEVNVGEDTLFNIEALCRSKVMVVTPFVGYRYTEHTSSATGRSQKGMPYLRTLIESQKHMTQVLREVDGSKAARKYADQASLGRFVLGCEWIADCSDVQSRKEMWEYWRQYWNESLSIDIKTKAWTLAAFRMAMTLNNRPSVCKTLRRIISFSKKFN